MLQYASKMINLQNDPRAIYVFETNTLWDFWLKAFDIYLNVGKDALKKLLLFPSTFMQMWILYPSARENKKSKPTQFYFRRLS